MDTSLILTSIDIEESISVESEIRSQIIAIDAQSGVEISSCQRKVTLRLSLVAFLNIISFLNDSHEVIVRLIPDWLIRK